MQHLVRFTYHSPFHIVFKFGDKLYAVHETYIPAFDMEVSRFLYRTHVILEFQVQSGHECSFGHRHSGNVLISLSQEVVAFQPKCNGVADGVAHCGIEQSEGFGVFVVADGGVETAHLRQTDIGPPSAVAHRHTCMAFVFWRRQHRLAHIEP